MTANLIRRTGTSVVILTLPILCIALLVLAAYSRYMRSAAMETLAQDYIKTARAKGLPERLVLFLRRPSPWPPPPA